METISNPKPNPIAVPLILQNIIRFLEFDTLIKCRLVSKLWEYETSKIMWIKRDPLTFTNKQINPSNAPVIILPSFRTNHLIISSEIGCFSAKTLIQELNSTYACQIKYLEIQNSGWTWFQLQAMLGSFERLEELTLSEDFILPKVILEDKMFSSMKQKPFVRLRSLQLNLKDESIQNLANFEFFQKLFSLSPNLKEIHCWSNNFSEITSLQTTIFSKVLLHSMLNIHRDLNLCKNITYLDINVDIRNEDMDLLQSVNLPLKTLHLPIDIMLSPKKIDNLVKSLNPSLKRLKLTHRNCIRSAPNLESIQNLEYLAIHGSCYDVELTRANGENSENSGLLQNYFDGEYYIFHLVPMSMFPTSLEIFSTPLIHLKELQLNSVYYIPKDVYNLKTFFPNLVKVKVFYLNDDTIRSIFKNLDKLETLEVPEGLFSDAGITGISPEVQDIVCNGVTNELKCADKLRAFPSILSLKCLRTLKLSSKFMTDFGVVNGIAYCHTVQELTLDFPMMGNTGLKKITEKLIGLDSLKIRSGSFSEEVIRKYILNSTNLQGRVDFPKQTNILV